MKDFILLLLSIVLTCFLWYGANRALNSSPEKKVLENGGLIDATIDVEFITSLGLE